MRELERQIAALRARLPKHSPSAAMMIELDELEHALDQLGDATNEASDSSLTPPTID
jgi:hypothetical protein